MIKFFSRRGRWAIMYSLLLTSFSAFVLLDTFVIPRKIEAVPQEPITAVSESYPSSEDYDTVVYDTGDAYDEQTSAETTSEPNYEETNIIEEATTTQVPENYGFSENSYNDGNVSIEISYERVDDTDIYVADINLKYASYLRTAFAKGTFGRNIKETTSEMALSNGAVFAVNGDYCGFRDYGFVVRNGTAYRDKPREAYDDDALVVYSDGRFEIVDENSSDVSSLVADGAVQVFSFGPSLVNDGEITVGQYAEVGNAMNSNPRTAIGMVSPLHYIIIVSDGRTEQSRGLSLYQLADAMKSHGCTVAYNLDGGGSSTMWFNGKVINEPTTNGTNISERKVSDIVYI